MAGTERQKAHIERGWERMHQGDAVGAEHSARQALAIDAHSAEALFLLGMSLSGQQRKQEALFCFQECMTEDETYVDPMLAAADIWLQDFGNTEECLRLCQEVIDGVDEKEVRADAVLLKAEALSAMGDTEQVLQTLGQVPQDLTHSTLLLRFAHQLFEIGNTVLAEKMYQRCISKDPQCADAHYELACMYIEQGREEESRPLMMSAYCVDAKNAALLGLDANIEALVNDIRKGFSKKLKRLLQGVPWYLVPRIGAEMVVDGFDPRALCFFSGTPADSALRIKPQLECVFIYTDTLQILHHGAAIRYALCLAIDTELAHFFAFGEAERKAYGLSQGDS